MNEAPDTPEMKAFAAFLGACFSHGMNGVAMREAIDWSIGRGLPNGSSEELARYACWCETCRPITMADMRMVLCPVCGNKRCPAATDHRNACTGSNEPGQPGSSYPRTLHGQRLHFTPDGVKSEPATLVLPPASPKGQP